MQDGQTTRATLISRLRDPADAEAWRTLEALYREMLLRFSRTRGLQHADADDVVQNVFTKLVTGLRTFEYDPAKGRFRDYLYRCMRSAIADWNARPKPVGWSVIKNEASDLGDEVAAFEREWVDHHYRLAIDQVRRSVDPQSIAVFEATLAGRAVREIAQSLTMSEQAVYKAQQRMRESVRRQIACQVRAEDGHDA